VFFAIGDPKIGATPDSWALGTSAAFALNFVLVMAARVLIARNMKEVTNSSAQNSGAVALEA